MTSSRGKRIHRQPTGAGGFAQIPNETARDKRLSYAARGVLAEILSRPDNWAASADKMAATARQQRGSRGEGSRKLRAVFRELEACGYLKRVKHRGPRGRMVTELHFFDVPAGGTDVAVTERRSTDVSVTDVSVTDASVSATSSRRPEKKTDKNTEEKIFIPDDDLAEIARTEITTLTGRTVTLAAGREAVRLVLTGRDLRDPRAYLLKAIRDDPRRFVPAATGPPPFRELAADQAAAIARSETIARPEQRVGAM